MLTFVYGGSCCGKSSFAERLLQNSADAPQRCYLATMWPEGSEAQERIDKHKAMRAGKGFTSYERFLDIGGLALPHGSAVLLECLGTLVANEMFQPGGAGSNTLQHILEGIKNLAAGSTHLIVISNEVGCDGVCYESATQEYQRVLATLNSEVCAQSDVAVEMVCGIPVFLKGRELCNYSAAS